MTTLQFNSKSHIARQLQETQSRWSSEERRERAAQGRRKTEELFRLVSDCMPEPDVWAVGSIGPDDLLRLAG